MASSWLALKLSLVLLGIFIGHTQTHMEPYDMEATNSIMGGKPNMGSKHLISKVQGWGLEKLYRQLRCHQCKRRRNKKSWQKLLETVDYCSRRVGDLPLEQLPTGIYHFYNEPDFPMNWQEASDYCKQFGLDLVSIESEEENNAIKNYIRELFKTNAPGTVFSWTSLNDLGNVGAWVWSGTGNEASMLDWHNSEPVNGQRCGEVSTRGSPDNVRWGTKNCDKKSVSFICEMPDPCLSVWPVFNRLTVDLLASSSEEDLD